MHSHDHGHSPPDNRRLLLGALLLTFGFAAVEAVAGWWTHSLALMADAGHMVTDASSLGIAALAAWISSRGPSSRYSYGLGKAEVVAGLINALLMLAVILAITTSAVGRLLSPVPVHGEGVILVAFVGLVVNVLVAWLLSRGERNINVRAALLHVTGDLLGSVAALLSGLVIAVTGWTPIDPILSLVIVALILFSTLRLLNRALHNLLEGVPEGLDYRNIGEAMAEVEGVLSVHDLHVWSISSEQTALSAHVVIDRLERWPEILESLRALLAHRFHIEHVTLQPEVAPPVVFHLAPAALRNGNGEKASDSGNRGGSG